MAIPAIRIAQSVMDLLDQGEDETGSPNDGTFSRREVRDAINTAYGFIWRRLQAVDKGFYIKSAYISLIAGQSDYTLPADFAAYAYVFNRQVTTTFPAVFPPLNLEQLGAATGMLPRGTESVTISPTPSGNVSNAIQVWYNYNPLRVTFGQPAATSTHPTGATKTLFLDAAEPTEDDIFNTQTIYIISGPGSGQNIVVTDYDGQRTGVTAKRCLGSGQWTGFPTPDSTYSSLLLLPESAQDALTFAAAVRLKSKEKEGKGVEGWVAERERHLSFLVQEVSTLLRHVPDVVRDVANFGDPLDAEVSYGLW